MCVDSVQNVSVDVVSAKSVIVSWLPPNVQSWNGIITSYTIVYELLGRADEDIVVEPISSQMLTIPQSQMTNIPDPRTVKLPLVIESAEIDELEEFYMYQFKMYLENEIGQSDVSITRTVEMPAAGKSYCKHMYVDTVGLKCI